MEIHGVTNFIKEGIMEAFIEIIKDLELDHLVKKEEDE